MGERALREAMHLPLKETFPIPVAQQPS